MRNDVCCIILAAGLSSRMIHFKPLMIYNEVTFLEAIINKVINYVHKVIVVTGYNSDKIEALLSSKYDNKKVITIFNPKYNNSMYISLLKGLELVEPNNFVLYHFVDQPTIPNEFYAKFFDQIDKESYIIQPVYKNKKGHPLIFSFNFCKHLLNSNIDSNLKIEMSKFKDSIKYWNCEYEQILKDYDTIEDYQTIQS